VPAIGVLVSGWLVVLVVLQEYAGALEQHLAVVGDLDIDVGARLADGVGIDLSIRLQRDVDAGFGLPIELLQVDAERAVELEELGAYRLAGSVSDARAREAHAVPERRIDEKIAQPIEHAVRGADARVAAAQAAV
jgi:hypothetical protein